MKKFMAVPAILVLSAVAVFAASLGSFSTSRAAASTTKAQVIKIGHIVDLTGNEAQVGTLFKQALNAANKQWGTVAGKKIQVITVDAQGTPAGAVNAARKLVETNHVAAIIGPTQVGEKVAVVSYIKQAKIPLILYNPTPPAQYQSNKWVVALGGSSNEMPTAMGSYVVTALHWKTLDLMTHNDTGDREFSDPLLAYVVKHGGGKVVQKTYVPEPTPDFSTYMTALKPADGLIAWLAGSDAIGFWNAYAQTGVYHNIKVAADFTGGFLDAFIVNNLQPAVQSAVNGTPGPSEYDPASTSPQNQLFVKTMTKVFGYPPDQTASASWQGYMLFVAALKQTKGNTSPATLLKALTTASYTGPEGKITWSNGSHAASRTIYILKCVPIPGVPNMMHYVKVATYSSVPPAGLK